MEEGHISIPNPSICPVCLAESLSGQSNEQSHYMLKCVSLHKGGYVKKKVMSRKCVYACEFEWPVSIIPTKAHLILLKEVLFTVCNHLSQILFDREKYKNHCCGYHYPFAIGPVWREYKNIQSICQKEFFQKC